MGDFHPFVQEKRFEETEKELVVIRTHGLLTACLAPPDPQTLTAYHAHREETCTPMHAHC